MLGTQVIFESSNDFLFCPWFSKLCISQNKERYHFFTDLSSFILAARRISKFSIFCCRGLAEGRDRGGEHCICVSIFEINSLSLSSRATCAPLFDEQNFSQETKLGAQVRFYMREKSAIGQEAKRGLNIRDLDGWVIGDG